jgi:hypothetical protein
VLFSFIEAAVTDTKPVQTTKAFQGTLAQKEVNYLPLSATRSKACANCRWFMAHNQDCFIVDCWPEPVVATGYCDRWEATPPPEPLTVEPVPVVIVEAPEAEPMEMSHEKEGHDHGTRQDLIIDPVPSVWTQLQNRIKGQPLKDGTQVLKDNAGRRYMFMITSNGYRDRDNAHVTTQAIEDYVEKCWTDDGKFIGDNAHYIWHTKELGSISDLVFADVWSGFLVELWREKEQTPVAKAFYNYVEKHPEMEWGASQGFFASKTDKAQGVYKSIAKYESTSLPRAAASNMFTLSEVLPMVEKSKRDTFLNTLFEEEFGIKDAVGLLKEGPEKLRATLADRGIEAKALGGGSDAVVKARGEAMKQNAELLLSMVEVQDAFDRQLTELTEKQTGELKTRDDKLAAIEKELQALKQDNAALRTLVNQPLRRAAHDESTVVTDAEKPVLKDALPTKDSLTGLPLK